MLRATARTNSFVASLLVHGAALGAAIVWVAGLPERGGQRELVVAVAPPAAAPYAPAEEDPREVVLPEEPPAPPPIPEVAEARVEQPLDPPPWLEPPLATEAQPTEALPKDPFEDLPLDADLRAARPEPVARPPADVAPEPPSLPAEPLPSEALPAESEPPVAPAPAPSSPAPLPGATPLPEYPDSWARRGWTGEVTIELDVAPDGRVTAARVLTSSGFARLDELARSTLATWRFSPATAAGAAVAGTFRQRVEFRAR